jgi:CheY-like chemotaxis protein
MTSPSLTLPMNPVADSAAFYPLRSPQFGVEFLTSLNHAIRTPMSGILGLTELMLENLTDAENREYLLSIRSCASALNDLLSATLDYASHASGAIRLEEQDFPLNIAIEAGLRNARQRAADNATSFEPELLDGLDRIVRSDALRLRDLVALIARVAIHSASNGKVRFRATLAPWGPHFGELTLEAWRETKVGYPLESLPQIGITLSEENLGATFSIENLEVALVHHVVELLRGSIRITSEPNVPLALRVILPIALRDAGLQVDRARESRARPAVLIADDNQISLRVLSSILTRAEFESVPVCSGRAAIEALAQRNFDLVLLDLTMPGMDGDVATARIRDLPNCMDMPVVGITAGVTEKLRENCRRNGMDTILGKPVDAEELVASVRFHLSRPASSKSDHRLIPI